MVNNAQQVITQFKALQEQSISQLSSRSLRKQGLRLHRKQDGFTLLELLVVVGILAIIGGALISSFGGQETKAAQGTAANAIAGIEGALRTYETVNGRLPDQLESLACRTAAAGLGTINNAAAPDTGITPADAYKFGGLSNVSGVGGGMSTKLADKFILRAVTAEETTALTDAGILNLRYAVTAACDNDAATTETVGALGGITVTSGIIGQGSLVEMDIPNHAFEDPRPDSGGADWENRGRGFPVALAAGEPIMVWDGSATGYNNKKLGADANDVLIGVGIGQASEFIGGPDSPFAKAPFYGQVGKDKYAHYIALINIGRDSNGDGDLEAADGDTILDEGDAFVQAVIDARGDFLDEEIAEFSGQKS